MSPYYIVGFSYRDEQLVVEVGDMNTNERKTFIITANALLNGLIIPASVTKSV